MNSTFKPLDWSPQEYADFGIKPQVNPHSYHELPLFNDDALVELLNGYPRKNLQAHTMGEDPCRYEDWKQVNIHQETTGAEMLAAVRKGRMWINLTHIEQHNSTYAEIIDGMYAHLDEHCEHLNQPRSTHSALLISSPGAQVYFHLDAEPNMIWHMRGKKHIWMYPAMDLDITPQDFLEDIYSGEIDEDIPYKPEYDELAMHHLLTPGEAASWPHNAPHRILNVDLNVSLATSYYTPDIYKRQYVQLANRFVLRNLGIKNRSIEEDGLLPAIKRMTYRVLNQIRPFKKRAVANYLTDLEMDPNAPMGMRNLSEPTLPVFARSSEDFELEASDQKAA